MLNSRHWLLPLAACIPCLLLIAGDDADDRDASDRDPDAVELDWEDWGDKEEACLVTIMEQRFQFSQWSASGVLSDSRSSYVNLGNLHSNWRK